MSQSTPQSTRRRHAFTLVELLVVIGIIAILISILIPVASIIRKRAAETRTRALIQKLAAACHAYFGDFNAYPGIIDDAQLYPNASGPPSCNGHALGNVSTTGPQPAPPITNVTSAENLLLSLIGGVRVDFTNGNFNFDLATVQSGGLQSLNPANPRGITAYIDYNSGEVSKGQFYDTFNVSASGVNDSPIPEFLDSFSAQSPIVYIRARAGAPGICELNVDGTPNTNFQYFSGFTQPYWHPPFPTVVGPSDPRNGTYAYFVSPSVPNSPRGKDTFLLISAGADGIYGNRDDIISAE